jgi:hypothetical protein
MTLALFAIGLVIASIQLAASKSFGNKERRYELILLYFLVIPTGVMGILAFFAHTVYSVETAESIGWPPNNPFQTEVAFANLSYGVAGILCIWFRGKFWLATIITNGIFLFCDGIGHIQQMISKNNFSMNNAGIILYTDLLFPIIGLILYFLYSKYSTETKNPK